MISIIKGIAQEKGINLLELAVDPDHVHVVAEIPPRMSLAEATQYLKGKSSYLYFKKHPNARLKYRKGHFWSPGKFYRTVGDVGLDVMRRYVRAHGDALQTTLSSF